MKACTVEKKTAMTVRSHSDINSIAMLHLYGILNVENIGQVHCFMSMSKYQVKAVRYTVYAVAFCDKSLSIFRFLYFVIFQIML